MPRKCRYCDKHSASTDAQVYISCLLHCVCGNPIGGPQGVFDCVAQRPEDVHMRYMSVDSKCICDYPGSRAGRYDRSHTDAPAADFDWDLL